MPELPEVETMVRDLNKRVIGRRIRSVWAGWPKSVKPPSPKNFARAIRGARFLRFERRGKNILCHLDRDRLLLIHPKMTGHLLVGRWELKRGRWAAMGGGAIGDKVNSHIRLLFELDDGQMLALSDARKFAKVVFGKRDQILHSEHLASIGPEPFDPALTKKKFTWMIGAEKRKIKQVLLDQEVISGIGNIYSDDILWEARVNPLRSAATLTSGERGRIFNAMRRILNAALSLRGTSISDFRDSSGLPGGYGRVRRVYRREGEPCSRCGAKIKRIKVGARSAHFCPACQR